MMIASIGESSSYRFVGGCCRYLLRRRSRDEVSISARGDYAGATNIPRSWPEIHLGWKASKRRAKTPTVLAHSVPRSLSVAGESKPRTRQSYTREKATIGSAVLCADVPWHEYECPERTTEVREVGIRIPGHIRPSPASPRF